MKTASYEGSKQDKLRDALGSMISKGMPVDPVTKAKKKLKLKSKLMMK